MPPRRKIKKTELGSISSSCSGRTSTAQSKTDQMEVGTSRKRSSESDESSPPKRITCDARGANVHNQSATLSVPATKSPPAEAVQRRSGRERKPSSMLKGMEVQITPRKQTAKAKTEGHNSPKSAKGTNTKVTSDNKVRSSSTLAKKDETTSKTLKNRKSSKLPEAVHPKGRSAFKDTAEENDGKPISKQTERASPPKPEQIRSSNPVQSPNPISPEKDQYVSLLPKMTDQMKSPKINNDQKADKVQSENVHQTSPIIECQIQSYHDSNQHHNQVHLDSNDEADPSDLDLTEHKQQSDPDVNEHQNDSDAVLNKHQNHVPPGSSEYMTEQDDLVECDVKQGPSTAQENEAKLPSNWAENLSQNSSAGCNTAMQDEGTACVELQQICEVPMDQDTASGNPAPSQMREVVLMDLDTGEQKRVGSKTDDKTKDSPEQNFGSLSETKHVSPKENGKDMEDEMMSLLDLFLNKVSDKKEEDKDSDGKKEVNVVVCSDPNDTGENPSHHQEQSDSTNAPSISIVLSQEPAKSPMIGDQPRVNMTQNNTGQSDPDVHMQVVYMDDSNSNASDTAGTKGGLKILSAQEAKDGSNMCSPGEHEDEDGSEGTQQLRIMIHSSGINHTSSLLSKPRYKDDLLQMSEDGQFCCKKCPYNTDKKRNWYKHKIKHRARQYQCYQCKYMAATSSNMKRHLLVHEGIRKYQCTQCEAKFNQKIHLTRHIKYKHEERKVQCTYCDYICASIQPDLVSHMKRKHADLCNIDKQGNIQGNSAGSLDMIMKFKCDKCNLYTVSRKDLLQHMKFHKKGSELKFFCELCSFVTESESRLKRHILTHTKEKPFKCGMCEYKANEAEHVKRHLKKKHQIDIPKKNRKLQLKNVEQDAGSSSESFLIDKSYVHRPKYPLSDTRNSEKHFACNFCTMKFTKLINLFKHVHVQHKQMMPYESVYSCVVCDYTTTYYKRLLVHMRKMHSTTNCMNTPQKQVYVCMLCNYSSPYRLYLHAHLKKEHNMQMISDKEGVNKYMLDASKHSSMVVQAIDETDTPKPGSIIKQNSSSMAGEENNSDAPSKDSKMVLVQLTPDGPMTPVFISMGETDPNSSSSLLSSNDPVNEYSIMETGIMDHTTLGIGSCEDHDLGQVLKEVAITPPPGPSQSTSSSSPTRPTGIIDLPQLLSQPAVQMCKEAENEVDCNAPVKSEPGTSQYREEPPNSDSDSGDEERTQIDSDQVVHLSSGDFVEINGQIYKIEMEDNNDKNRECSE